MVSEGRVIISSASRPAFGSTYQVKVCRVGAQVASASSGTTVNVQPGHGFLAGDKFIVGIGEGNVDGYRAYRAVASVTATTLELESAVSVAANEYLCNLSGDTGGGFPLFDSAKPAVYSDMGYTNQYTGSLVAADSTGRFRYHHLGVPRWHLILTSTQTPIALDIDTGSLAEEDPVSYQVRYAHLFADGGTGTASDPWTTTGSNPIQAALDDLPAAGVGGAGIVRLIQGVYDLGSDDGAVVLSPSTGNIEGYTIEGYGMGTTENASDDGGSILLYSGTGSAFMIGDMATTNYTTAFCTFRNFKVRQTGTAGTGIAFLCREFRQSTFESVLVEDFDYGWALASVSDFNTFRKCSARDCATAAAYVGYTTGMNTPNGQCNGNLFQECDFMNLARDSGRSNYGIFIDQDSVNNVIRDSRFHNFDTGGATNGFAAIICKNSNRVTIDSNYFEGNFYAVWIQNSTTGDFFGHVITNNYITQIDDDEEATWNAYGVRLNCGDTGLLQGAVISGNQFTNPSTSSPYDRSTGIIVHNNCRNVVIAGNEYINMALADVTVGGASATYVRAEDGALTLTGTATVAGALSATSSATIGSTLGVTGVATLTTHINVGGNVRRSVSAAVTASTTQTQVGGTALTADINNVSVCANANDTVVLPTAVAGMRITIMNNGAQTLKIYPASGDNLGAGVDTSTTLAAGSNVSYVSYDATNWEVD